MAEWQPIETAPHGEHRRVLLFCPGPWRDPTETGVTVGSRLSDNSGWWLTAIFASGSLRDDDHRAPTHWMPLPEPPQ